MFCNILVFGSIEYFELSNNFPKMDNVDYYCFTNLKKSEIGKMYWNIIEIDNNFLNTNKNKNIMLNRYFKFMVWINFRSLNKEEI